MLGEHQGLYRYTVGQRQGLGIAWRHPLFVTRMEPEKNRLVVGPREALASTGVVATRPVWHESPPEPGESLQVRVRYRSPAVPCSIKGADQSGFNLELEEPVSAVTPGQAAVLYRGDLVVGGGWIHAGGDRR